MDGLNGPDGPENLTASATVNNKESPKAETSKKSKTEAALVQNLFPSLIDNRISKLASVTDEKTIISQLIRENSDRVRLIEFKDARADIWQYFRLVCLDGQTLSYAVCVRCMKPVSYKVGSFITSSLKC